MNRLSSLFWKRDADVSNQDPTTTLPPESCNDDCLRSYNTRRLFHIIERKLSEQDIIDDIGACLKNGADVNGQNDTGRTVLYIAEQKNYQKVVEFLLGQGGVGRASESSGPEQQAAGTVGSPGYLISGNTPHPPDAPGTSNNASVMYLNSVLSGDISKDLKELLIDMKIEYSSENYIDLLETVEQDSCSINDKLKLDPYPSAHTLALLALKAYLDKPDKLPEGWDLLTTAGNPARTNGYFGAAFWCRTLQQVVVAHRGTGITNTGAMLANYKSIISYKNSSHMHSAITFTDSIASTLTNVTKKFGGCYQLSITGHSLGGWLAQVTTFTVKYLQKDKSTFRKVRNVGDGFHAHTVVFDSPGCRTMLSKMKEKFDLRYDRSIFLRRLDISSYLSAPNRINSLNPHLGIIYRVVTDLSDVTAWDEYTAGYTSKTHSMEKMAQTWSKLETPNMVEMLDWPLRSVLWGEEYNKFFKSANRKNEYHQQTDRYEFKEINRSCCSLRIFSEDELLLLDSWLILKKSKLNITNLIKIEGLTVSDLFDEFVIDKDKQTVSCTSEESIKKLIRHTKALARWLPVEVMAATKEQAAMVPTAAEAMFRAAADSYLHTLERSRLDFRDTLGLEAFLTSGSNILIIRTPDSDAEMMRLMNIFQRIACIRREETNNHYSFMDLKGIKRLESAVSIQQLFQSCFTEDYLFIIQCSENYIENCETVLIAILNNLKNNPNNKLVFVESHKPIFEDLAKSFYLSLEIDNNFILKHTEEMKLNDLSDESMKTLFEQKIILLQGKVFSLRDLVGEYRHLTTDRVNSVNTLIGPQMLKNLLTIGNYIIGMEDALLSQDDLKVHSTINTEVSTTRVAQALREHSGKTLVVISGIVREELKTDLWSELLRTLGEERISTTMENGELIFQKKCREEPSATVFWLAASTAAELLHCKGIYMKEFYIERKFVIHKYIFDVKKFAEEKNKNIIQNNIFVFQNVDDKESLISTVPISVEDTHIFLINECIKTAATSVEVDDIIEKNPGKAVHILKREAIDGLSVWQRTRGSLEGLRPYVTADTGESVDEGDLRNTTQKVVIIADEPGMGKSTSLTSISRLLRPSGWVIRIDLKDFQIPIQNLPSELNLNSVCKFILRDEDSWLRGLLYFCLDKQNKHSREVYLLFDGFDEIKQNHSQKKNCTDAVLRLLKYVNSETLARIWITTRLHRREIVENELSIFAMHFEKIDESRQREYVVEFWHTHLLVESDHYGDAEKIHLEKCAEFLYENVIQVLGDDVQNFMGIPLQMRMLAEVFMERVKHCVESKVGSKTDIRNTFDVKGVLDLYQQFVSRKYDIYLNKTGLSADLSETMNHSNVEQLTEKHRLLALHSLFPEFANDNFDELEAGWGGELCRVGLVQASGVGGENIEFIHRTLAEHFCADLAVHWLRKRGRYYGLAPMVEFLLSEILLQDSHSVIRTFIDKLVLSQPLPEVANRFSAFKISELWCDNVKQRSLFNQDINTALHIAVLEKNTGIITILVGGLHCELYQKVLIAFIAAHNRDRYTALGWAARETGDGGVPEIMEKFVQSVETRPHEVILELLLATYLRCTDGLDDDMKILSEYAGGEAVCPAINKAFTRTQEIIREDIPRLWTAVRGRRAGEVQEVYSNMESDTERRYMLLALDGGRWEGTVLHIVARDGGNEEENQTRTQIFRILCNQNIPEAGRSYNMLSQTPLHVAAAAGQLEIVEHLINHGVYINSLSNRDVSEDLTGHASGGETALFAAASYGKLPVVEYLLEKGIAINTVNDEGETALFLAAHRGRLAVVEYLVEKGIAINAVNVNGETALFPAASYGTFPVLEYLVEKGLAINTVNEEGETALFSAVRYERLPVVKYLLQKGLAINTVNNNGETALFPAARYGRLPEVEYLVDKGIAINTVNVKGETALFLAIIYGKLPVVEYLLEKGSAINKLNNEGETALFPAARYAKPPLVEYLLEKGLAINTVNDKGETALFSAARDGKLPLIEYLLKKGLAINTVNVKGETALFSAARDGTLPVVEYLVDKGFTINPLNAKGETVLFSAVEGGSLPVVKFLVDKGLAINTLDDKGETALFSAARNGKLPVVEYLVDKGLTINTLNNKGETALFSAIRDGNLPVVEYLVDKGLAINTLNDKGENALFSITYEWSLTVVKYLVERGLDISIVNNEGETALFRVVRNGWLAMVKYLVQKGSDINIVNKRGETALDIATKRRHRPVLEYLNHKLSTHTE